MCMYQLFLMLWGRKSIYTVVLWGLDSLMVTKSKSS